MKTEKYRFDQSTGTLYEYDKEAKAYLFVSKTQKKNEKSAVAEYKKYLLAQELNP